jgi:hypothetical protein
LTKFDDGHAVFWQERDQTRQNARLLHRNGKIGVTRSLGDFGIKKRHRVLENADVAPIVAEEMGVQRAVAIIKHLTVAWRSSLSISRRGCRRRRTIPWQHKDV